MAEADTKDRVPTEDELRSSDAPKPGGGGRSTSGLDMDSLLRDARGASDMPIDVKGITAGLTNVSREKSAAGGALSDRVSSRIEEDRGRMRKAQDATAIGPDELKPWNEKAEKAKYDTPPLEAFGSLASVFAIMASAFTHTPMVNALNGAAAAMNGIRDHDEKAYQSAYDAWKQNTNLALKRHEIQQQQYDNAGKMLQTDIAAGSAEMQMLAAKFNDKQVAVMIEHGMIKEVFELLQARQNAAMQMIKLQPEIENTFLKNEILEQDPEWKSNDPQRMKAAKDRVEAGKLSPEEQIFNQHVRENPGEMAGPRAEFWKALHEKGAKSLTQLEADTVIAEGKKTGDMFGAIERLHKAKAAVTVQKAEEKDRAKRDKENQFKATLDDAIGDLEARQAGRKPPLTGLVGAGERALEWGLGSIGAMDRTDASDFQTKIRILQAEWPRLATGVGRISAAERAHLDQIIRGMGPMTNTEQALSALKLVRDGMFGEDEAQVPQRPAALPDGSAYSPSRKQWRSPDGKLFDLEGKPVQ